MATQKELFERIAEAMADDAEVVELCEKYVKRISAPRSRKKNEEFEEFTNGVATWLAEHEGAHTLTEMAEALGVSRQKVTPAITSLRKQEVVEEVKVEGLKTKAYAIAS